MIKTKKDQSGSEENIDPEGLKVKFRELITFEDHIFANNSDEVFSVFHWLSNQINKGNEGKYSYTIEN